MHIFQKMYGPFEYCPLLSNNWWFWALISSYSYLSICRRDTNLGMQTWVELTC